MQRQTVADQEWLGCSTYDRALYAGALLVFGSGGPLTAASQGGAHRLVLRGVAGGMTCLRPQSVGSSLRTRLRADLGAKGKILPLGGVQDAILFGICGEGCLELVASSSWAMEKCEIAIASPLASCLNV